VCALSQICMHNWVSRMCSSNQCARSRLSDRERLQFVCWRMNNACNVHTWCPCCGLLLRGFGNGGWGDREQSNLRTLQAAPREVQED
jgi:hypothetical protein